MEDNFSRLSLNYEILSQFSIKELIEIGINFSIDEKFPKNGKYDAIQKIIGSNNINLESLIFNLNSNHITKIFDLAKINSGLTRYENQVILIEHFNKLQVLRNQKSPLLINYIDNKNLSSILKYIESFLKYNKIDDHIKNLALEIQEVLKNLHFSNPFNKYRIKDSRDIQGQYFGFEILITPEYLSIDLSGDCNDTIAAVAGNRNFGFSKNLYYVNVNGETNGSAGFYSLSKDISIQKSLLWSLE